MARTFNCFKRDLATTLVPAVNAYLATLTNPIIRGFWPQNYRGQNRVGAEYAITIETDTGGSAIGTPWLLNVIESNDTPDFITAVQAFETTATATGFCSAARLLFLDNPGKARLFSALNLYNATSGASANFLLL